MRMFGSMSLGASAGMNLSLPVSGNGDYSKNNRQIFVGNVPIDVLADVSWR